MFEKKNDAVAINRNAHYSLQKEFCMKKLNVLGIEIAYYRKNDQDYVSLTDMLKAKDGDFFISDWLRNRNTVEFLGIWERVYNPDS